MTWRSYLNRNREELVYFAKMNTTPMDDDELEGSSQTDELYLKVMNIRMVKSFLMKFR